MKNNTILIVSLIFFFFIHSNKLKSQVYIGMRDNYYGYCGVLFNNKFDVRLEHSLYSEKLSYQKVRLYAGFVNTYSESTVEIYPYISSVWNGFYKDCGCKLGYEYKILNRLATKITINPNYDSQLEFDLFYSCEIKCKVYKDLSTTLCYSCIPEIRDSEKRIRAGLSIDIGRLYVSPSLSLSTEGHTNIRSFCSFKYIF